MKRVRSFPVRRMHLRFAGAIALGVVTLAAMALPAQAARYALVIGINDYKPPVPKLLGAVNDANDIAASLQKAGAKHIIKLVDGQATRAAVTQAWTTLLGEAKKGDTLVFSYAGHGSQEPARKNDPEEPDGLDENFLLANYATSGPGVAERIVDNEVAAWLADANKKGVHVVFVADACHSGTMFRSVTFGVRYRSAPRLKIDAASLSKFAPPLPDVSENISPDSALTFLAAVPDDRQAPELTIADQPRGGLSWAFARSLEGAADTNHDGRVTEQELTTYIRTAVQQQSDSQQITQSFPPRSRAIEVLANNPEPEPAKTEPQIQVDDSVLKQAEKTIANQAAGETGKPQAKDPVKPVEEASDAKASESVEDLAADALKAIHKAEDSATTTLLKIAITGGGKLGAIPGAEIVTDVEEADLVYDAKARTVEKRVAGVVAEDVAPAGLPGIVAKWRAIAYLKAAAGRGVVPFEVDGDPRTYAKGERLTVQLTDTQKPFMTLFNLPPDGKVEFLYPADGKERDERWTGKPFTLPLQVRDPPFGSEHLIAIMSDAPLDALVTDLKSLKSPTAAVALPDVLARGIDGESIAIGIANVFTSGAQ